MPGCGQRQASVSCGNGTKSFGAADGAKQKKSPLSGRGNDLRFDLSNVFVVFFCVLLACPQGTTLI